MEQENFRIAKTGDNKTQFTRGEITIIIDQFSCTSDKHQIADPKKANAYFECCGETYFVENIDGLSTVEDWYLDELLPKFQMLTLLEMIKPM